MIHNQVRRHPIDLIDSVLDLIVHPVKLFPNHGAEKLFLTFEELIDRPDGKA